MDPGIVAQAGHVSGQAPPQQFNVAVRGDDRHQVDERIRPLETQARQLPERDRPSYSRPGSRIEQLLRLAEEQVTQIVQESRSAANARQAAAKVDAAELRAAAENEAAELRAAAKREIDDLRASAEREADGIWTSARREAGELTSVTEREVAKLRAMAGHEVAEKRAAVEREIAKLRTTTEREVAQLKASAMRERDEILTTTNRLADEMLRKAQRILEESEAGRAQAAHAKAQADQLMADTKTELERHRVAAQREVDELNRQKDAITTSLEQLRLLVSGRAPAIGPPAETARPAAFE